MPTPSERKALLFLAAVAVLGGGVRVVAAAREGGPPGAGERAALARQIQAVDSAQRAERRGAGKRSKARERPPAGDAPRAAPRESAGRPAVRVDVDRAGVDELEALPRIGPALARRIVADRDSLGAFGSLEGLDRVRGVGPAMVRELAPYVTFSGTPRPSSARPLHRAPRRSTSRIP